MALRSEPSKDQWGRGNWAVTGGEARKGKQLIEMQRRDKEDGEVDGGLNERERPK